ncbi:MAG: hypothetical protein NTZ46_05155 [Verrucomicrobia bacterium]|nr:hypothetical protein [Verrucomicrobiota bacterium]
MIRLILGLSVLFLALGVLVGLPVAYVVWMIRAWRGGRKMLFWSQTGVAVLAVLALGFLLDLTPASHWYWERQRTLAWTGVAFSFGKPLYHCDTGPSFNGDGYVATVVALKPEIARYFSAPPASFFTDYPAIPGFKDGAGGLQLVHWHNGPVRADEERFVQFAVDAGSGDLASYSRDKDLTKEVRRVLNKPTSLYAYYWRYPGEQVSDIYFFLIDPEEGRLYIFQNNT